MCQTVIGAVGEKDSGYSYGEGIHFTVVPRTPEDLTEEATLESFPDGGEGPYPGEQRVSGKALMLGCARPIEKKTVEASGAGTE